MYFLCYSRVMKSRGLNKKLTTISLGLHLIIIDIEPIRRPIQDEIYQYHRIVGRLRNCTPWKDINSIIFIGYQLLQLVEIQDEKRAHSLRANQMTQRYLKKYALSYLLTSLLSEQGISQLLFIELPCAVGSVKVSEDWCMQER